MKQIIDFINKRLKLNNDSKIPNKPKIDEAKLKRQIAQFCKEGDLPKGMWANGKQLNRLTKMASDIFGETIIKIIVPYSNFNCYGSANKIYEDVEGQMPFSKNEKDINTVTTLFYGDNPIKPSNYLPFLASSDCFYVIKGELKDNIPTFELKKYYESFM